MKQKLLSSAVAAALVGAMGTSQAVYNNPDGLGEVLIFPYYTVEGTIDTYINLVNTTSVVKAVKVRFLEGMNSQEVIDFNLYLLRGIRLVPQWLAGGGHADHHARHTGDEILHHSYAATGNRQRC